MLLEKEMATYSSILAWRIPWTEEPGGLQSMGHKESDTTEWLTTTTTTYAIVSWKSLYKFRERKARIWRKHEGLESHASMALYVSKEQLCLGVVSTVTLGRSTNTAREGAQMHLLT